MSICIRPGVDWSSAINNAVHSLKFAPEEFEEEGVTSGCESELSKGLKITGLRRFVRHETRIAQNELPYRKIGDEILSMLQLPLLSVLLFCK